MKIRKRRLDWSQARTLADLGELTAHYLEGEADDSPTHCGTPADETVPIAGRLAALNRTGLVVTHCSQPGEINAYGRKRAFVDLFCAEATMRLIEQACQDAGLGFFSHPPGATPPRSLWEWSTVPTVPVNESPDGYCYTDVGGWMPPGDVAFFFRKAKCHRDGIAVLLACWQVTAYDLEWGREGLLWYTLREALA